MAQSKQIPVRTDKDLHFVGALAQNEAEWEDIQLPQAIAAGLHCTSQLRSIAIISKENLAWELVLWKKKIDPSVPLTLSLDDNPFLGKWRLDAGEAIRIGGAGPWYYFLDGMDVAYEDEDRVGKLHVCLVNKSAAAKSAGVAGEIVVIFNLEPPLGW